MIKAAIFDLDGTLADSTRVVENLTKKELDFRGINYPENLSAILAPLGYGGTKTYFAEQNWMTYDEADKMMNGVMEELYRLYANEIPLKPFSKEILEKYKKEGAAIALLSASPHTMIDPFLKNHGVFDSFQNVWSTEDFGLTKSQPELFTGVCKILGVLPSETIFFDDNYAGLSCAKGVGIYTVGVYDDTEGKDHAAIKAAVDRYVLSFDELL